MTLGIEYLIATVTGLCSVIGFLWRNHNKGLQAERKRENKRLSDCEKERDQTRQEVKELFGKVNRLEGKMEGVENLSRSVLETLQGINPNDTTEGR